MTLCLFHIHLFHKDISESFIRHIASSTSWAADDPSPPICTTVCASLLFLWLACRFSFLHLVEFRVPFKNRAVFYLLYVDWLNILFATFPPHIKHIYIHKQSCSYFPGRSAIYIFSKVYFNSSYACLLLPPKAGAERGKWLCIQWISK